LPAISTQLIDFLIARLSTRLVESLVESGGFLAIAQEFQDFFHLFCICGIYRRSLVIMQV
jgi:hypothetical protein